MASLTITETVSPTYATLTLVPVCTSALTAGTVPTGGSITIGDSTVDQATAPTPSGYTETTGADVASAVSAGSNLVWTCNTLGSGQSLSYDLTALTIGWAGSVNSSSYSAGSQAVLTIKWGDGSTPPSSDGMGNYAYISIGSDTYYIDGDTGLWMTGGNWTPPATPAGTETWTSVANESFGSTPSVSGFDPGTGNNPAATGFVDGAPATFTLSLSSGSPFAIGTVAPDGGTWAFDGNTPGPTDTTVGAWTLNKSLAAAVSSGTALVASHDTTSASDPTSSLDFSGLTVSNAGNQLWSPGATFADGLDQTYTVAVVGTSGDWNLNDTTGANPIAIPWNESAANLKTALNSGFSGNNYNVASVTITSGSAGAASKVYTVVETATYTDTLSGDAGTLSGDTGATSGAAFLMFV